MLDELTYTLGEKKKTCLDVWFKTIPPLVLEGCYFFYLVFNRLSVLRILDRRNELERLFTVIVFPVSQSGSVPTVRRKPSADLFHLSLSLSLSCQQLQGQLLERRAAELTIVTTSLSLSGLEITTTQITNILPR